MARKPDAEVVALLETILTEARRGTVQDVFVLFRCDDGSYDYQYLADDPPDMLFELGSTILKERGAGTVGRRQ